MEEVKKQIAKYGFAIIPNFLYLKIKIKLEKEKLNCIAQYHYSCDGSLCPTPTWKIF